MVRKINNTLKKGVTLAELVVIMAVLSIISTMVVSFIVMSGESVSSSKQKADALNDLAIVENMMESWLNTELDNLSATNIIDLNIEIEEGAKKLSFNNGALTIKKNDNETTYKSELVDSIQIVIREKEIEEGKKIKIAICYITYELIITNTNKKKYTYTFCVYPYDYIGSIPQQGGE